LRRKYSVEPRQLPCGDGRLIIALNVDRFWDVVYYRPRHEGDLIGERFAVSKRILLDALRVVFAEADEPFDADAMIDYIRGTSWGSILPQLTARREPVPMPQDERQAAEHGHVPDIDYDDGWGGGDIP
jgi:hypothetical protein